MNQEKGFSLIEVTIAVAIIGLAFYSLISVFKVIAPEDVNARTISVGAHIASRLSEETMSRGFNNIASVAATSVGAPFAGYKYQIIVNYADPANPNNTIGSATSLKKIRIQVWQPKLGTLEIVTLASSYELN